MCTSIGERSVRKGEAIEGNSFLTNSDHFNQLREYTTAVVPLTLLWRKSADTLWSFFISSFINSFLSQMRISNKQSICGLRIKRNADFDSVTSATGTPQESRIWDLYFIREVVS
jgi:hypothetical protein